MRKLPSTRRTPYSEAGIKRVPCVKCGQPARFQWRICSTSQWTAVCAKCDVVMNRKIATWAYGRTIGTELVDKYEDSIT